MLCAHVEKSCIAVEFTYLGRFEVLLTYLTGNLRHQYAFLADGRYLHVTACEVNHMHANVRSILHVPSAATGGACQSTSDTVNMPAMRQTNRVGCAAKQKAVAFDASYTAVSTLEDRQRE